MNAKHYEVIIVGGGISGSALFYELARYSDVESICMLEKYEDLATLNSKGTSNSQTIHVGDIETNYTFEKAKITKRTANMIEKFNLQRGLEDKIMFKHQKMALGVGEKEVEFITQRYEQFKEIFPYLELWDKETLREKEPLLVYADKERTKDRPEPIVAMGTDNQYTTVDFGEMTKELAKAAQEEEGKTTDIFFNAEIEEIEKVGDKYKLTTTSGSMFTADFVVVNAGAHSLFLAHKMGYGKHMGSLSMAGSFYITNDTYLNGKVYMVQNDKLPFAALHGDPDILCDGKTRFGPTALALLVLERYKGVFKSLGQCLKTMNIDGNTVKIFWDLLKDSDIRNYVFKNFLFEVPGINKSLFVKDAQKIVPSLSTDDIEYAKGFGGVRPQVLDKAEQKLMLGEASINPGGGILFNMTPSPGATSCLGNAERDIKIVCEYLNKNFDEEKFLKELTDDQ